ncbi:hypothetical protein GOBAR_DD13131 [Gossypium barbadense]|nr:hypothetical protein GOBAR_DD13131 [Gossypium barbadense]
MNNAMFLVYVIYYDEIVEGDVGCIFQGRQRVGLQFNKNVKLEEMKRKISAKIAIHCGPAMSRLFYKFPISTNPLKFCEMQLLNDDDLGTMIEIWWSTGNENPQSVELFAALADLKLVKNRQTSEKGPIMMKILIRNIDEVLDDIDDESPEEVEDAHIPSFSNLSCGIVLRNEPRGDMLNVDPDTTHASKFPEYTNIVHAHRLASNSQLE